MVFTISVSASGSVSSYLYCTVKISRISFESVYRSRTVFVPSPQLDHLPSGCKGGCRDDVGLRRTPTSSKYLVLIPCGTSGTRRAEMVWIGTPFERASASCGPLPRHVKSCYMYQYPDSTPNIFHITDPLAAPHAREESGRYRRRRVQASTRRLRTYGCHGGEWRDRLGERSRHGGTENHPIAVSVRCLKKVLVDLNCLLRN
jgi:hypothetical protein